MGWKYIKTDDNYNIVTCPMHDLDGTITGRVVYGLKHWFDENPQIRKQLGWIKCIKHEFVEGEYDKQTEYVTISHRVIDEYTIEQVVNVLKKPQEMLLQDELRDAWYSNAIQIGGSIYID